MRILLVEDDRDVAKYIRRELEEEGHPVSACHDGASGLRTAERTALDIIVLDVMLPFMDGLEVTRRLRRQSVRTPILLLTARDAPGEIVRGLDSGADDYLTKPFSFDVLLARIRVRTRATAGRGSAFGSRTSCSTRARGKRHEEDGRSRSRGRSSRSSSA